MQAYILVSGKQDKIISHQTMKQVAKLESKTNKVDNIRNTTSIVSLMNQELKSSASSSLISQSGSDSSKLQTDIMANLTSKQKQDLQTKLQASLTTDQTAQITQFTTTILTTEQKAAMAQGGSTADLTSSLSADQQTKVSAYTMSILTTDQQAAYKKLIIADLPSVEKMSTPLLRDLMLDSNGNVRSQLKSLLPKNGKHLLIMATTSDKSDMTTDVQLTKDLNSAISDVNFDSGIKTRLAGNPIVMGGISPLVYKAMETMLVLAVIIMIIVLFVVFPVRRRLLSLTYVLLALICTFGLMGWLHIDLTLATMATLPIIIGLGTDFGVQFHNRYEEEFSKTKSNEQSITNALGAMGPAVGIALIVMIFAFLTMFLSKAPMMQQFGLTLAIGVAVSYVVELVMMFSTLSLMYKNPKQQAIAKPSKISVWLSIYARFVMKHAKIITLVGIILAAIGFSMESKIPVETNMTKLIPQDMTALKNTTYLQKQVGSTTYLTYLVKDDDVRDKSTLQDIKKFAYKEDSRYNGIVGVSTLESTYRQTSGSLTNQSQSQINSGISQLPSTIKTTMLTSNNHYTMVQFKVKKSYSTEQEQTLMKNINKDLKHDDTHLNISSAGTQNMMITGVSNMTANHGLIIVLGLAIIAVVLLLLYHKIRLAILPLFPIAIVLGLSPLTLHLLGESYNPLTIALSSLVLGIGTEFTILILERFHEEQRLGKQVQDSMVSAVSNVGQAITASGLTVVGGFAALIFVNFPVIKLIWTNYCPRHALLINFGANNFASHYSFVILKS